MLPRFGEPVLQGIQYTQRPGAYAIIYASDCVLLTFQEEPFPEFQLPGGGIDMGESPLAALHREVLEETGWKIRVQRRVGCYRRYTYMPEYDLWARKICHIYAACPVRSTGEPVEEGHSAYWVPCDLAVQLFDNPGDAAMLASFFDLPCLRAPVPLRSGHRGGTGGAGGCHGLPRGMLRIPPIANR